jgi:hypothetical protein
MTSEKYIILKHPVHAKISDQECLDAIPEAYKAAEPIMVEIKPAEIDIGEGSDDWEQLALDQKKQFLELLKPTFELYPEAPLFYFGFAPIPLIIHLGSLCYNWRKAFPMIRSHAENKWYFELPENHKNSIVVEGLPTDENLSNKDVNLDISISHKVNSSITKEVTRDSLMKTIQLGFMEPQYEALTTQNSFIDFGNHIDKVFRSIKEKYPRIQTVHVFASIPVGAAFMFGVRIQPNIYPVIQSYQYKSTSAEQYQPAILLNSPIEEKVIFTEEEQNMAASYRQEWDSMLKDSLKKFIDNLSEKTAGYWYGYLDNKTDWTMFNTSGWNQLEPLVNNKLLAKDRISQDKIVVADGFDYDQVSYTRDIDTGFFVSLERRLKEKALINKAGRLFLIHESLHYSFHGVNKQVANGIGNFPKVVEEADYQADIYALLHEYAMAKLPSGNFNSERFKEWFIETIFVMTETMWSFDDNGEDLKTIQVRRMNRYLIWYWQSIRIKYANTLTEIFTILSEKPIIEFSGLKIKAINQRIFYNLESMAGDVCEMTVYAQGKVTRATPPNYQQLIEGFRERNGEKVKDTLEMFYKVVYR